MTVGRLQRWRRLRTCSLDDYPSCPKHSPNQLTSGEVAEMRSMVLDSDLSHIPISNLALLAAR